MCLEWLLKCLHWSPQVTLPMQPRKKKSVSHPHLLDSDLRYTLGYSSRAELVFQALSWLFTEGLKPVSILVWQGIPYEYGENEAGTLLPGPYSQQLEKVTSSRTFCPPSLRILRFTQTLMGTHRQRLGQERCLGQCTPATRV